MRKCLFCGADISAAHWKAKYCSPSHRVQHANGAVYDPNRVGKRGRPPKEKTANKGDDASNTPQRAKRGPYKPRKGKEVADAQAAPKSASNEQIQGFEAVVGSTPPEMAEKCEGKAEKSPNTILTNAKNLLSGIENAPVFANHSTFDAEKESRGQLDKSGANAVKTTLIKGVPTTPESFVGFSQPLDLVLPETELTTTSDIEWATPNAPYAAHPKFPFDFPQNGNILRVEDYSIYPQAKRPAELRPKKEYDRLKKQSDDLIRDAWADYQNFQKKKQPVTAEK